MVRDPEETKFIKLKLVKSKIVIEQILTENLRKFLAACKINPRDNVMLHSAINLGQDLVNY
jgi:hypothetical protein